MHISSSAAVYVISVAADLAGMHPQTLRQYDRLGLVTPERTAGRGRRYAGKYIAKLRLIQQLSQDEGVNLVGIKKIIDLQNEVDALKSRNEELEAEVRSRMSARRHPRTHLGFEFFVAALERIDLVLQVDDLLDPDEVDALILGQLLDQPKLGDVLACIPSSPSRSAFRSD